MADHSERTAREREEARLERERQRAQRLGQNTSEQLAVSAQDDKTSAQDGQTPAQDRKTPARDVKTPAQDGKTPAQDGKTPARDGKPSEPGTQDGTAHDLDGHGRVDGAPPEDDEPGSALPEDDEPGSAPSEDDEPGSALPEDDKPGSSLPEDELADEPTGAREVPLGIRRATHRDRLRTAGRRDRPRVGRRRNRPGAPQRRSWVGRAISLVALALGVVVLWFLIELFQPLHGQAHGTVTVTIAPHSGASQIGDQLERDGVISSSFFFGLRAMLAGDRGSLLSGTYSLKRDMSYGDVLRILTTPPPAAKVTNVTLIEGLTRRQIDALLRSQGVRGSYLLDTRSSRLLDPRRYGAPSGTPSLEGFLFPSTYQLREPLAISALVADQLQTFRQRFPQVNLRSAERKHLTPYDILIVASMVQAEAQTSRDGPLVASVIYNRLAAGMPLQIDATTRYATGNYTHPLTQSELNSPSPYNTRIHKGLPPTPIDNPGLAAMQAAAHPANTNYLYFVVKPCGNGEQVFTGSYKQFLHDVAKYQAARARNGGRSPAHC